MGRRFRADKHRPEFEAHKPLTQMTDPFLSEQNRPGRNHANQHSDQNGQRQYKRQNQQDEDNIQYPFPTRDFSGASHFLRLGFAEERIHMANEKSLESGAALTLRGWLSWKL